MNIKPCPFCGAIAQGPKPIFDSVGYTITHSMDCYLLRHHMKIDTCFYEDNPHKIEDWNKRVTQPSLEQVIAAADPKFHKEQA